MYKPVTEDQQLVSQYLRQYKSLMDGDNQNMYQQ